MFARSLVLGVALIALASPLATAAPAGGDASAKAFVQNLYVKHIHANAAIYDAPMLALMRRDTRLAHGEVGALDSDPLCQCQDDSGMRAEVLDAHASARSAVVHVRLTFTEEKPALAVPVELDLVRVGASWRVHDVKSKDTPSLRAYLTKHAGGR